MEDKWDICLYDNTLYFARSWTGELWFRAIIEVDGVGLRVTRIDAKGDDFADRKPFAIRVVDFLIKSHLLGFEVPHPLPSDLPDDPETITTYSFQWYGRRGLFATCDDI